MRAELRDGQVSVSMTADEAWDLLRELDKWPELPQVERDVVDALKAVRGAASG
jgi:hypothetical protein